MEPAETTLAFPSRAKISASFKAKQLPLISNHYTVSLAKTAASIFLYDIKILDVQANEQIPGDARILRQDIMRKAREELQIIFEKTYWWSGQIMWSRKGYEEAKTVKVVIPDRGGDKKRDREYAVVFTKARKINLGHDTFTDNAVAASALHYLNILIKRFFKEKNFVEWGLNSKFYDPNEVNEIKKFFLQIYTGFKTSCQVYQNHTPKVLIDFSSKILRSDSALFYIQECQSSQKAKEMLEGRSVVASYGNYRMWRVNKVDFSRNPRTGMFTENGNKISVAAYFDKKYNIKIRDMSQPLLVNIDRKTQKESLLVPELVQMTGLDDDMRKDFHLMNEVAQYTRLNPPARYEKIKSLCQPLADFFSKDYGISMEQQSSVMGRMLNPPKLKFGNRDLNPDKGNYQVRDPVFKPAKFDKWLFLYDETCAGDARNFVETLKKCAGAFAIGVRDPKMVSIRDKSEEALTDEIVKNLKTDTQIIVAMYPPISKKSWYKALDPLPTAHSNMGPVVKFESFWRIRVPVPEMRHTKVENNLLIN